MMYGTTNTKLQIYTIFYASSCTVGSTVRLLIPPALVTYKKKLHHSPIRAGRLPCEVRLYKVHSHFLFIQSELSVTNVLFQTGQSPRLSTPNVQEGGGSTFVAKD